MENMGTSRDIVRLMRFIGEDDKKNINEFYNGHLSCEYRKFDDLEMALMCCDSGRYSDEARDVFSNYSGFNYRRINACARGKWNYEEHGHIREKERFDELARELKTAIDKNQRSIGNVLVFRGVSLDYFSEYGVTSLDDLDSLKGNILLDKGFVSTSLVEDACYYKKSNELGLNYNVKIEYLVPEEFEDGVSIGNVSYSPNQSEYLVNSWNIAKVIDVSKDGMDGAIVKAMFIPKKVYDKAYRYEEGNVK